MTSKGIIHSIGNPGEMGLRNFKENSFK
jgi:hypothetical protein